jgi:hypothetical protein
MQSRTSINVNKVVNKRFCDEYIIARNEKSEKGRGGEKHSATTHTSGKIKTKPPQKSWAYLLAILAPGPRGGFPLSVWGELVCSGVVAGRTTHQKREEGGEKKGKKDTLSIMVSKRSISLDCCPHVPI